MSIHIEKFSNKDSEKWDKFVCESRNGTIFSTRKFLNYHPEEKFNDCSLVIRENSKWLAVFPASCEDKTVSSHPGASYGGLLVENSTSIKKTHLIVDELISYYRDNEFKKIKMTLPPIIYHTIPSNYIDFVLLRKGFSYTKRELSAYIPVSKKPFNYFKQTSRTATRKARKEGVAVRETDDIESFYKILEKNLGMRHNVEPTHSLQELKKLKEIFPSRIRLFASFYQGKQIAGTVIFEVTKKVSLAFYISHLESYQNKRPVNILFYKVIKWAYKHHYSYLDLGTFTLNMKPNFGLGRFKESLGAQGIFRDYMVLNL